MQPNTRAKCSKYSALSCTVHVHNHPKVWGHLIISLLLKEIIDQLENDSSTGITRGSTGKRSFLMQVYPFNRLINH